MTIIVGEASHVEEPSLLQLHGAGGVRRRNARVYADVNVVAVWDVVVVGDQVVVTRSLFNPAVDAYKP